MTEKTQGIIDKKPLNLVETGEESRKVVSTPKKAATGELNELVKKTS